MSKSPRATLALNKVGVNFTLHSYDYDPDAERIGLQAAEAIGVEPRRVLKNLMAEIDGKPSGYALTDRFLATAKR
jgi:Cys-tRNA(Pro)/Cys-tRNA(Cys) deacylase